MSNKQAKQPTRRARAAQMPEASRDDRPARYGHTTPSNLERAAWADAAIRAFRDRAGCDHEDSLGDLLCDPMHWADTSRFDFDLALERARGHYVTEIAEGGAQ